MRLLLDQRRDDVQITEDVIKTAAAASQEQVL
jgi:hypothetical protein